MNENIYNIDFGKLVRWLIPPILRRGNWISWLLVLVAPVVILYQSFLRYRKAKLYQLMITPQVCWLERMLNDSFDFSLRRIKIIDAIWYEPTYLYQEAELKPVGFYKEEETKPIYLYTDGEAGSFKDDFIVQVPAGLIYNDAEMRGKIDAYKLAGTKYKIQVF